MDEAARARDPESALRSLTAPRKELDEFIRNQVPCALASGRSYDEAAHALQSSPQAAHRRYRELAPERPPKRPHRRVATDQPRGAMRLAREQSVATGEPAGSEPVLLGLAASTHAARALRARAEELRAKTAEALPECAAMSTLNLSGVDATGTVAAVTNGLCGSLSAVNETGASAAEPVDIATATGGVTDTTAASATGAGGMT